MVAGMRSTRQALLGDTVVHWPPAKWTAPPPAPPAPATSAGSGSGAAATLTASSPAASAAAPASPGTAPSALPPALPGFVLMKPMLYATLYPLDAGDFDDLRKGVSKLAINDATVRGDRHEEEEEAG